jgi:ABC-type amino acid transport substrate-binding protein
VTRERRNGQTRGRVGLCLLVLAAWIGAAPAQGDEAAQHTTLRVAVKPIAPFVFKEGTEFTGFSIDLWRALAQRLKVDTRWVEVKTVGEQLQAVQRGDADVAIAAISITMEREKIIDFTQPYFDSGLQILVHADGSNRLLDAFASVPWATLGALFGLAVLLMFVMANVLWLVERRSSRNFQKGYLKGVGEGLWGAALVMATGEHGDRDAPKVVKRLSVFFMWLLGVMLVAQLTATVTSSQTVERLKSNIRGPADLPGKKIATVRGTVAADYLAEQGLPYVDVGSAEEGFELVRQGEVQAMVFDAPTLQYLVAKRGEGKLRVVGPIFAPDKYGIVVADGSPLRKRIDSALLAMVEDGRYREIYNKWFAQR